MRSLFVSILKNDYLRERGSLFWIFIFPMILFFILTSIFGDISKNVTFKIGVLGESKLLTGVFQHFPEGMRSVKIEKKPEEAVRFAKVDVCLVIPEDFDTKFTRSFMLSKTLVSSPVEVTLYYVPERQESQMLANMLKNILEGIDLRMRNVREIEVEKVAPKVTESGVYCRYLFPAVLLVSIMSTGIFAIPSQLSFYREKKILKRLLATPLTRFQYLFSILLSGLVIMVLSSIAFIAFARFVYGIKVDVLKILPGVTLSYLVFLSFPLMLTSIAKTTASVNAIGQVVNQVFMFMGGFYFDVSFVPWPLKALYLGNPASYLVDLLRRAIGFKPQLSNHFLVPAIWIALSTVIFLINWRKVMVSE